MEQIYDDVPTTSPLFWYVNLVSHNGTMSGFADGKFHPERIITRAELCVYVSHLLELSLDSTFVEDEHSSKIPLWVVPYYNACKSAGLLLSNFSENINDQALVKELLGILSKAVNTVFGISWIKELRFSTVTPFSDYYLTRGLCANIMYQLCNGIACIAQQELFDNGTNFQVLFDVTRKFKWVRDFFTDDQYQIFSLVEAYTGNVPRNDQISHMVNVTQCMSIFSYRESSCIYHYTSLITLDKLTQPNAKFRLSNISYLNDPKEGKLGMKLLTGQYVKDADDHVVWSPLQIEDTEFPIYPTFIASFMRKNDELPMWVQYGDKGAGCCLGFSCDNITEPLYTVKYSEDEIQKFFSNVIKILENYQHKYSIQDCDSDPVFKYARDILIRGCFLYKADSYKHEDEVRIVMFVPFSKAKVAAPAISDPSVEVNKLFSKIYSESPLSKNPRSDIGLDFVSITLGPTVQTPEQVAVALAQRGYDPKIIQKSKINFR